MTFSCSERRLSLFDADSRIIENLEAPESHASYARVSPGKSTNVDNLYIKPARKLPKDTELTLKNLSQESFDISRLPLKPRRFENPLVLAKKSWTEGLFLTKGSRSLADTLLDVDPGKKMEHTLGWPTGRLHFEPSRTIIGVVTCGGLCPGLNDVIHGIVSTALEAYGFKYSYWGQNIWLELASGVLGPRKGR